MSNYFSIPKPCSEDWNKMTPTEKGAFCGKCAKEVLDCSRIKTTEIKGLISKKTNPCVRIQKGQIDDLNLIEWFNSLTLRKQLKYLFLFAFLFIFEMGGAAQESDSTLIQPQHVVIDSVDEMTTAEVILESEYQFEAIPKVVLKYEVSLPIYDPLICGINIVDPFIYGDFIVSGSMISAPIVAEAISPSLFAPPVEKDVEVISSNYLSLGNNRYTFFIEEDVLVFNSNAQKDENIRIKIKKNGGEIVYFNPIRIPLGQRQIEFSLDDFDNGTYSIILESETETKGIELTYW